MNEPIKIVFTGEVKTKSNRLFFQRGRTYIPSKIVEWENNLRIEAIKVMNGQKPLAIPVKVTARVYRSNKRKCDLGNFNKSAFDALNGVVYVDDYLICEEHMFKLFDPLNPRIELDIEPFIFPAWATNTELPLNLPDEKNPDEDDQTTSSPRQSSDKPKLNSFSRKRKASSRKSKGNKKKRTKKQK